MRQDKKSSSGENDEHDDDARWSVWDSSLIHTYMCICVSVSIGVVPDRDGVSIYKHYCYYDDIPPRYTNTYPLDTQTHALPPRYTNTYLPDTQTHVCTWPP